MTYRRIDYLRLLRLVPAITELSYLDASGREQLRLSRLTIDVTGSQTDYSRDPRFTVPKSGRIYYGPVYFRKESEPYMTIAMPGGRGRHHGGRDEPQVHLGRGQPDQDRTSREGLRRRRPRRPHRAPRHQPGPPEDQLRGSLEQVRAALPRRPARALDDGGPDRPRPARTAGAHDPTPPSFPSAGRCSSSSHWRRRSSPCAHRSPAPSSSCSWGWCSRRGRQPHPRAPHGAAHPRARGRRRQDRRRRPGTSDRGGDRR